MVGGCRKGKRGGRGGEQQQQQTTTGPKGGEGRGTDGTDETETVGRKGWEMGTHVWTQKTAAQQTVGSRNGSTRSLHETPQKQQNTRTTRQCTCVRARALSDGPIETAVALVMDEKTAFKALHVIFDLLFECSINVA